MVLFFQHELLNYLHNVTIKSNCSVILSTLSLCDRRILKIILIRTKKFTINLIKSVYDELPEYDMR